MKRAVGGSKRSRSKESLNTDAMKHDNELDLHVYRATVMHDNHILVVVVVAAAAGTTKGENGN